MTTDWSPKLQFISVMSRFVRRDPFIGGTLSIFLTIVGLLGAPRAVAEADRCADVFSSAKTSSSIPSSQSGSIKATDVQMRTPNVATREQLLELAASLVERKVDVRTALAILERTPYASEKRPTLQSLISSLEYAADQRSVPLELPANTGPTGDEMVDRWIATARSLREKGLVPRPPLNQRLLDASAVVSKESRDRFYVQMLTGMDGKPDLYFQWNVARPEAAIPTGDGRFEMLSQNKPAVEYRGDPYSTSGPFVAVQRLMSMPIPMPDFYKTVYGNYENRIRDAIVEIVERIEDKLPPERMSWGEVQNRDSGEVYGTMRVFDGTVARRDDVLIGGPLAPGPADALVFQRILEERGIDYKWKRILKDIKTKHPFRKMFEIGKFSLDKTADPEVRERTLLSLEYFILDHYVLKHPNAIFFAHTATEANKILNIRRYGFKVVETINVPGSSSPEHILMVPAKKLKRILMKRIKEAEAKFAAQTRSAAQ